VGHGPGRLRAGDLTAPGAARLADRAILVTGGGSGIGLAIARACVAEGARVLLCGRRTEPLQAACAELGPERACWVQADVAEPGDPARAVAAALDAFGRLDGLVNNAAVFQLAPLAETSDEDLLRTYRINVIGLLACCREAQAPLVAAGGSIVNVSSVVGQGVLPNSVPYAGSKAAVDHITRCLAAELGPLGVRVNCVAPGTTETDMTEGLLADAEARAQTVANTPLGRIGKAEDVAPVAVHLLSDEAGWVTGQVIQAGGGLLL
jgi:NAD(P)-dependent dehydrogenase (short-subunit alcohol dehydrogenase family)